MNTPRYLRFARFWLGLALLALAARAEDEPPKPAAAPGYLGELLDRIPNLGSLELPSFMPEGMFRFYSSPHFGDLLHRDYVRVPVGMRAKLRDQLEVHAEVEGYFTHGLSDAAGYGFDRLGVGGKYVFTPDSPTDAAWSTGLDLATPLSRPPSELSDGHRHIVPNIAVSRPIFPAWRLLGYGTLGADLLSHTALPANFGRNQLHTDALTLAAGVARDWPSFNTSLTATYATSALLSDENAHVFSLRPAVIIPLTRMQGKRTRLILTLSARSTWGPDGHEFGTSANLRVDFLFRSRKDLK